MTGEVYEEGSWTPRRWAVLIGTVLAAHVGFVFWLGDKNPIVAKPAQPAPSLHLAESDSEWLELRDPTVFALPRERGFAGLAWRMTPTVTLPVFDWKEAPKWREVDVSKLGAPTMLPKAEAPSSWQAPALPMPQIGLADIAPAREPITRSVLRIESDRPVELLTKPQDLPSWPARMLGPTESDLLTNSIVQVMIAPDGFPISATLLSPGSGLAAADEFALAQARQARFAALPGTESEQRITVPLDQLRWCRLVFDWHTTSSTNMPSSTR